MATVADIRKNVTDLNALYAVVGATDLAVERLRSTGAQLQPRRLQARAEQVPTLAVSRVLEAAGKAEDAYSGLSTRGRVLVGRLRRQRSTQETASHARTAATRSRAAVSTARRTGDETAAVAGQGVAGTTAATRSAARRTASTARKGATASRGRATSAGSAARRGAGSARTATADAAEKVGD